MARGETGRACVTAIAALLLCALLAGPCLGDLGDRWAQGLARDANCPVGCERGEAVRSSGCCVLQVFQQGELARPAIVRAPTGGTPRGEARPVVLALHGGGGRASDIANRWHWLNDLVDELGVVMVYPAGIRRSWGIWASEEEEISFFSALLQELATFPSLDLRDVSVVGFSQGAAMAHTLGSSALGFRKIVPLFTSLFPSNAPPATPTASAPSVLQIVGERDPLVPVSGGRGWASHLPADADGRPLTFLPAEESVGRWADFAGCTARSDEEMRDGSTHQLHSECLRGQRVEGYVVAGAGHELKPSFLSQRGGLGAVVGEFLSSDGAQSNGRRRATLGYEVRGSGVTGT